MKKLMILGAGVFQVPAVRAAKDMGLETVVCGMTTKEPAMAIADIAVPVSTIEREKVLEVAKRERIDGIMTIASELSVPTVAYVAEKMALPGYGFDTATTILNKYRQREALARQGVPCPRFGIVRNAAEAFSVAEDIGFPAIVKPLESSGSRGVSLVSGPDTVERSFVRAASFSTGEKGAIIEQFIEGREIGGECLVYNGELAFFEITNKYVNEHYVPCGHSVPTNLDSGTADAVRELIERCIGVFGLESGPVNMDVMITPEGPVLLEIGARLGGNCLPDVVSLGSGVDTVRAVIAMSLGEKPALERKGSTAAGVRIFGSPVAAKLEHMPDRDELQEKLVSRLLDLAIDVPVGGDIEVFDQGSHRFGHAILAAANIEELEHDFDVLEKESISWCRKKS